MPAVSGAEEDRSYHMQTNQRRDVSTAVSLTPEQIMAESFRIIDAEVGPYPLMPSNGRWYGVSSTLLATWSLPAWCISSTPQRTLVSRRCKLACRSLPMCGWLPLAFSGLS